MLANFNEKSIFSFNNVGFAFCPPCADTTVKDSVSGLIARGNFQVTVAWENMKVKNATIISNCGNRAILEFDGAGNSVVTNGNGNAVSIISEGENHISFDTRTGEIYHIEVI